MTLLQNARVLGVTYQSGRATNLFLADERGHRWRVEVARLVALPDRTADEQWSDRRESQVQEA